ncbi:MAG: hypothetical protein KatS3mg051_1333 [Anaerolineae bacterium]|nr:MAG: hypothetical protein KatS3mg051_1333 [Anaerolineae bacterium]
MSTTTADTAGTGTERAPLPWRTLWDNVVQAVLSLVLALLVGGVLLVVSGRDPIAAYRSLYHGAFGTTDRFTETLVKATPLLLVAVSVSICFRAQVWNIGAEGQMILGAIFSTWVALNVKGLPPLPHLILAFLAGALGGMLWSLIAGRAESLPAGQRGDHHLHAQLHRRLSAGLPGARPDDGPAGLQLPAVPSHP